jgi:HPt (histidine-containing phosphotransfer) domain-containing protein
MLDLEHLSRQTSGDRALERAVLGLFVTEIAEQVQRLRSCLDRRERVETAHAIVGSATAIGAFDVARIAARIGSAEACTAGEVADLADAVERTCAFIATHLGE